MAFALAVIVLFVLYGTRQHQDVASAATAPPGVILDSAMKPAFDKVVDKFTCGCGKCTEPLWECNCPVAEKEKSFVKSDLQRGEKATRIINAVYRKYGHLAGGSKANEMSGAEANFDASSLTLPK